MIDWDLEDYGDDPWGEWQPGARECARDICKLTMIGLHQDESWAEEDEPRYLAALLYAGVEPTDEQLTEHAYWQEKAALILMQKYRHHWWVREQRSPEYRQKARTCRRDVQVDELRKFYTWLCSQRKEPWTDRIVPK